MGSYGWARLRIGGKANHAKLMALLDEHVMSLSPGMPLPVGEPYVEDGCRAYLEEIVGGGLGWVVVEDDQASYARFDELETELIKMGVSWDRDSDAVNEFPAMSQKFRKGMPTSDEVSGEDGEPLVSVAEIRKRIKRGLPAFKKWLATAYPVYPPLPPIDFQ